MNKLSGNAGRVIMGLCGFPYFILVMLCSQLCSVGSAHSAASTNVSANIVLAKNSGELPVLSLENRSGSPVLVRVESDFERVGGERFQAESSTYTLAAGESKVLPIHKGNADLIGTSALLRCQVFAGEESIKQYSSIVGTPKPVERNGDFFIAVNSHLARYEPDEMWRMLQMMRAAGIRSTRVEVDFPARDVAGSYHIDPKVDQALRGAEAFGINVILCLSYFNDPFYRSGEKSASAYRWARYLAELYKGRVFDWQYGNETNSGWAAFGAAADMAAHNQAMALGTLSVEPNSRPGTLGIAEADPNYLRNLFHQGLEPYVRAVTLHPYCGVPEAGIAKLEANRRVIAEFGGNQEIWATEIGFHFAEGGEKLNPTTQQLTLVNGFTKDQQANFLARTYILGRAKGINRIYWYNLIGKNDPETFWLLDQNFQPQPAYQTLKFIAPYINDSVSLGGTASTEPVQIQLFRRSDGSVFLAAWALRETPGINLHLPPGNYSVTDIMGSRKEVDPTKPVTLEERPIFVEGLSTSTTLFDDLKVLMNTLDARDFNLPMARFTASPKDRIEIPYVVFNSKNDPIKVCPRLVETMPGWKVDLPEPFLVNPGATEKKTVYLSVPENAVRGVEYRFSFAAEIEGPTRSLPYEIRVNVDGQFPYESFLSENAEPVLYKIRKSTDEASTGFGRASIIAREKKVNIDGNLLEWAPEEFVPLDQEGNWKLRDALHPTREDHFVKAALRWDKKSLYVAFLVLDDDLSVLDMVSRDWRDADNMRVFLSAEPDPDKRQSTITKQDILVLFAVTRQFRDEGPAVLSASVGGYTHEGAEKSIKVESRAWSGGYLVEASIPFSLIGVEPHAGLRLGCNLLSDDADNGFRKSSSLLHLKSFDYWNNPKSLGQLILAPWTGM